MIQKIIHLFTRFPELLCSLVFGFCIIMLGIQTPFCINSPDVTLYSSTIIRGMHHELFSDPFSGSYSILPSFFGAFFGLINSFLQFNIVRLLWCIELFCFIAFFILYFCIAFVISDNRRVAALITLSSGLVLYNPTGRFFLLPGFFNFGILFVLASLLFSLYYVKNYDKRYLIPVFFFSGLAIATWWYFFLVPVVIVLSMFLISQSRKRFVNHLLFGITGLIPPGLFIAWHLLTIRNVLPLYIGGKAQSTLLFLDSIWVNFGTLMTRGSKPMSYTFELIPNAFYLFNTFLSDFIVYCIVIPTNLIFLLLPICYCIYHARYLHSPIDRNKPIIIFLMLSGYLLILFSFFLDPTDSARVERNQFVGYIFLSLCCFFIIFSQKYRYKRLIRSLFICCSIVILVYTSFHGTDLIIQKDGYSLSFNQYNETQVYSELDAPVIQLLETLPNRDNSRIFVSNEDIKILAPQVPLRSFYEHRGGLYTSQDPVTAANLGKKYEIISQIKNDWPEVLREENIQYMLFTTNMKNYELVKYYSTQGTVIISNSRWIVIDMEKKSDDTVTIMKIG